MRTSQDSVTRHSRIPLMQRVVGRHQAVDERGASEKSGRVHWTDAVLVRACLQGDASAWSELVERYGRLVYSIPRQYGFPTPDCDRIFQNVFTMLLSDLGTLQSQNSLTAWLIAATHRESVHFAKRTSTLNNLDQRLIHSTGPSPEQAQRWERQHQVHQALRQIEPRCRELLRSLVVESSGSAKLTARVGLSEGNTASARARCFKELEAILIQMGVELEDSE